MTESEIKGLEDVLGLELPAEYRHALLEDPLAGFRDDMRPELLNDANELIDLNLELRAQGFFGLEWTKDMLAIGTDGGGGVLYLRLSEPVLVVYIAAHDGGPVEGEVEHADFGGWVEELRRDIADSMKPTKGLGALLRQWWGNRRG